MDDPTERAAAPSGRRGTQQTASQRGRANGEKGKRAERAMVSWLRGHGWPGAERTVRTGHRVPGRVHADQGDIDGTPGLVWQLKDVAERRWSQVPTWLADTEAQRDAAGADIGILVLKRPGHADAGDWWAWLCLADLLPEPVELDAYPATPITAVPVRLTVADLAPILHHVGYGTEATA